MTVGHNDIVVGKRYKFTYADIEMVGVCTEIRDSFPRTINMRTDDNQNFGIYAAFLEEVE